MPRILFKYAQDTQLWLPSDACGSKMEKHLFAHTSFFVNVLYRVWIAIHKIIKTGRAVCAQPCPGLCDPMNRGLPSASVSGVVPALTLEWAATFSSSALAQPGSKPVSPALQVDSLPLSHQEVPWKFEIAKISFHKIFIECEIIVKYRKSD